ncbi:hypothetical protein Lsan_3873 [Legionella santicrucis]|uniref:Uncharacterized protein n=1 Tax=Legionella santicrucis TaxID=45074 RepID=A0A0W0Y945_9GAMM|nr:hypothetical protein [Legionella santicrucis]KTD53463.1 hypothetical protein Lsan_3873 [Legionella santicrucis]
MRQAINCTITFRDTSFKLQIKDVYQVNEQLIVISKISSTGCGGEAITPRSSSVTVNTNADTALPVKYYAFVSDNIKSFKSFTTMSRQKVVVINELDNIPGLLGNGTINPLEKISDLAEQSIFAPAPSDIDINMTNTTTYSQ